MNLLLLAWKNILGSPFRSGLVFLCMMMVAGSTIGASLIIQGAEKSLRQSLMSMQTPGADLLVIPGASGTNRTGLREVNLDGLMENLASVPGVAAVSPQLLFLKVAGRPYSVEPELLVVALDPITDFTILPLFPDVSALSLGEVIAGNGIRLPPGQDTIHIFDYELKQIGHLAPTGSSLDRSLFITFETAQDLASHSFLLEEYRREEAVQNLPVIQVRIGASLDAGEVANRILKNISGVSVFDGTQYFQEKRKQVLSLLAGNPVLLGATWILSMIFVGLIFSIAANERRREIGVLRAIGSTRSFVFHSLLLEVSLLSVAGGMAGALLVALFNVGFHEEISRAVGIPLASTEPAKLLLFIFEGMLVAFMISNLAVLFPAWKISHQDPAVAMKG